MSHLSPTLEGFRAAFRRPSLTLAEITWRWMVGATAIALCLFSLLEYLDTLPLTNGDMVLLRTRQPILIGQALGHIFRGSLPRIVMALLVATTALILLWILAASVGRAATVRSLIDHFAERQTSMNHGAKGGGSENQTQESIPLTNPVTAPKKGSGPLAPLLRLNFLRAATALAAVLGCVGAMILVQMVSSTFASNSAATAMTTADSVQPPNPGVGLAFLLFFPLVGLILVAWSTLNWVLSLAGIFAVCGAGESAQDALATAVGFCRERAGPVFAVSTWTGLAHLTVFVVATTAVSMPLSLAQIVPGRIVLVAVILVTVGYFAVADWLYMVRLAGYVCIAEMPEALLERLPPLAQPSPLAQTTIDRDEVILSDLPNLA